MGIQSLSIVVTNYNYSKYLRHCVQSIITQNAFEKELIIIDDGSRDGSQENILFLQNRFKHFFGDIKTIFLNKNMGKLHALNIGIPQAEGDITIILDADDYLAKDYISQTINFLSQLHSKDPRIAFVYTDCFLVDTADHIIGQGKSSQFDVSLLFKESYIPECGPTFTKVLKSVLPLEETIRVGTKHHKWLKIIKQGWRGAYLSKPLFFYRMHQNNLSGIGKKIISEISANKCEAKILSGYWTTTTNQQHNNC